MQSQSIQIKSATLATPLSENTDSYSDLVVRYFPEYRETENYIEVGELTQKQGWLIHVSVIVEQSHKFLEDVLSRLHAYGLPFRIPKNKRILFSINSGVFGGYEIGKFLTIYLTREDVANELILELQKISSNYVGPHITGAFYLGHNIFTRYGSFILNIKNDSIDNKVLIIQDGNGNMVLDQYTIAPQIPVNIAIPFDIKLFGKGNNRRFKIVNGKYLPVKQLKSDMKGDVWKCLTLSKYYLPKWCIIKQGKKGMFPDNLGREVKDRLIWQYKLSKQIGAQLSLPEIYELFIEDELTCIAIEYVKGRQDLAKYVLKNHKKEAWLSLSLEQRKASLDIIIQVAQLIEKLHELGYLHRDITPTNFLVQGKKNELRPIDLELAYNLVENDPNPPFGVGTPGYMSREQEFETDLPGTGDDVFSFGGLIQYFVTSGVQTFYVPYATESNTKSNVEFWVGDKILTNIISKCTAQSRHKRPNIREVINELTDYRTNFEKITPVKKAGISQDQLQDLIQSSIESLGTPGMMTKNDLWYSMVENGYGKDVYPDYNKHYFGSIYRGSVGVIWLLLKLEQCGYDISSTEETITANLERLLQSQMKELKYMSPSLYYGTAGIALLIKELHQSRNRNLQKIDLDILPDCFTVTAESADLMYGASGVGLSLIQCTEIEPYINSIALIENIASKILSIQNANGSWSKKTAQKGKEEINTTLTAGVAGIAYFLLCNALKFEQADSAAGGLRALDYLSKIAIKKKTHIEWQDSNLNTSISTHWCKGAPGIALAFLKGYELTKIDACAIMAKKALQINPFHITSHKLSQCHGLSGLGEIYLEAFRVTQDQEWLDRATWLLNHIVTLTHYKEKKTPFWYVDQMQFPTADFMIGNSGVLHFLARYSNINSLSFPVLQ